jgi:ketosteroid isomerase-like protein
MSTIKQELEQVAEAYRASFNRQDAAGVAALYTSGGVHMNPSGPTTDVAGLYSTIFKAGFNQMASNIDEAWPLGPDAALAMGKYRITGKDQNGGLVERGGYWTGTYVREAGKWKIRMETALPK